MPFVPADAEKEYEKDLRIKREDVKSLMEWVDMQPHLPKITELQAILFLHSCFYSNEQAKITLDNYFTIKTMCSDLFGNRTPDNPSVIEAQEVGLVTILPKQTPDGNTVMICRLLNCDPDRYNFANQLRNFDMILMRHLFTHGTSNGVLMIFDMQGAVFGHLTKLNIVVTKKFLYYLQEAMPIRIKGLHYINVVSFMDKILTLMKPFMKKELMDMIILHTHGMDSFYKAVPKDILPQEYGGQAGSLSSLKEKETQLLVDNKDFYKWEETQLVDEKQRPGRPKQASDFFGVEGTFKKLEVD